MNAATGSHGDGSQGGPGTGSRPTLSRGWVVALVAGVVALLVIAVTAAIAVLRDDPAERWAAEVTPSISASPSPSPSPTPTPSPTPAEFDLAALEVPTIESVLSSMPQSGDVDLESLPGKVAVPEAVRTPVWAEADVSVPPRLALASTQYEYHARWLVLQTQEEWVQVLLPYGRGALPSSDPEAVNGVAGWVREDQVSLEDEDRSVVIDLSDRAVIVRADGQQVTVPAGIGKPSTPTPQGLSQVMTVTMASNTGMSVFLSAQSETLDTFAGVNYAATAMHVGIGQGQEVSNGCIRLTPAGFDVVKDLPAGVPVVVRE